MLNGEPDRLPADVAVGDWDDLLSAVKGRLRRIVGEPVARSAPGTAAQAAERVQADVLECASALDQLHLALSHALSRNGQLERDVTGLESTLAQLRLQLRAQVNPLAQPRTQAPLRPELAVPAALPDGAHRSRHGDRDLALRDALTSLPNRRCFGERLSRTLALAHPQRPALAVVCLDLDGFAAVNAAHGCDVGDEVLRIVAARLAHTVRAEDLVSRLGGDAFACLLADPLDAAQLGRVAGKLFDAVAAPLLIGALRLTVQPSIGIAVHPGDGATAQALIASADAAMRGARQQPSRPASTAA